jgi:hypothetical protein
MATSEHDEAALPESAVAEQPSGPAAAAILAAGIGALVLGILTTWAEASEDFAENLNWDDDVGPLSGKTIVASIGYFASWLILHLVWRRSNPPLRRIVTIAVVLLLLGLLGTFPTFFEQFAPE